MLSTSSLFCLIVVAAVAPLATSRSTSQEEGASSRNVHVLLEKFWEDGIVPYEFREGRFGRVEKINIKKAMKEIESKTCVRFFERKPSDRDYLIFDKHPAFGVASCGSYVGKITGGGGQVIEMDAECATTHTILGYLMVAIGFYPEHQRDDRDKYITMHWNNIYKKEEDNFHKKKTNKLEAPYDVCSVTHHGPSVNSMGLDLFRKKLVELEPENFSKLMHEGNAFSVKPQTPRFDCKDDEIGERTDLSKWDVLKINTIYKCHGFKQTNIVYEWVIWYESLVARGRRKVCGDISLKCSAWKGRGMCKSEKAFMVKQCKNTCRICYKAVRSFFRWLMG